MSAGIVDHEAHTRDIRRLGGLRRLMPITFAISTIAALSMAGIPPLNGFLSKEMMLEETTHTAWLGNPWIVPALAGLGALLSVAYSFRFLGQTFLGPVREDYPHQPHDPGPGLWLAPALLTLLVILGGLMPMTIMAWLVEVATSSVIAGRWPSRSLTGTASCPRSGCRWRHPRRSCPGAGPPRGRCRLGRTAPSRSEGHLRPPDRRVAPLRAAGDLPAA